jgi:hypothetical protein
MRTAGATLNGRCIGAVVIPKEGDYGLKVLRHELVTQKLAQFVGVVAERVENAGLSLLLLG